MRSPHQSLSLILRNGPQRSDCRVGASHTGEIPKALSQGEGQFREFKSAWDRRSDSPRKLNWKTFRVGAQIQREPQELINQRKQALRVVGYEQRFRAEATLDDLDLELAKRFLDRTPVGERPVEEALEYYGLIDRHLGQWKITNAAVLLFARRPALKWHPRAGVRVFRVAGRKRLHGRRRNVTQVGRADPPLAMALEEARTLCGAQVRQSERLNGLYFERVPEYPEFAWQEALVNAIAHRDYEVTSRETEVWFFDDRVEISNPGNLIAPVTLERLRQGGPAPGTRNPMLVRVLADTGAMRDEGEGVARIFDEMADRQLPEPDIECEGGLFTIRLFGEDNLTA